MYASFFNRVIPQEDEKKFGHSFDLLERHSATISDVLPKLGTHLSEIYSGTGPGGKDPRLMLVVVGDRSYNVPQLFESFSLLHRKITKDISPIPVKDPKIIARWYTKSIRINYAISKIVPQLSALHAFVNELAEIEAVKNDEVVLAYVKDLEPAIREYLFNVTSIHKTMRAIRGSSFPSFSQADKIRRLKYIKSYVNSLTEQPRRPRKRRP